MRFVRFFVVAAVLAGVLSLGTAWAQGGVVDTQRDEALRRKQGIADRPRPQYDAVGIRAGGFIIYPDLTFVQMYDDNIFSQESNTTSDFIAIVSPQIQAKSNWSRHELDFSARGDIGRYFDKGSENYEDVLLESLGRYDISRDSNIFGGVSYASRHEDRGSPDDVQGINPTIFETLTPQIGFFQKLGRFKVRLVGDLHRFDFRDVASSTGLILNNDDRDRNEYSASGAVAYEIVPAYDAFVRFTYSKINYLSSVDDFGIDRDSHGYEFVAGTAVDITGVIFGNVFVGYRKQKYDDVVLSDISGPGYGADITWNVTGLTTLKFLISRGIEETTLAGGSGLFATRIGGSVDHELLRNLVLNANGSIQFNNYEGINRDDTIYRAAASGRYFLNRNLYVSLAYEFLKRESSTIGQNFTVNTFLIRLETQL